MKAICQIHDWTFGPSNKRPQCPDKIRSKIVLTVCKYIRTTVSDSSLPCAADVKGIARHVLLAATTALAHVLTHYRKQMPGQTAIEFLSRESHQRVLEYIIHSALPWTCHLPDQQHVQHLKTSCQIMCCVLIDANPQWLMTQFGIQKRLAVYLLLYSPSTSEVEQQRLATMILGLIQRATTTKEMIQGLDVLVPLLCRFHSVPRSDLETSLLYATSLQTLLRDRLRRHGIDDTLAKMMWQAIQTRMEQDVRTRGNLTSSLMCLQALFSLKVPDFLPCLAQCFWTIPILELALHSTWTKQQDSRLELVLFMLSDLAMACSPDQEHVPRLALRLMHLLPRVQQVLITNQNTSIHMASLWFVGTLANLVPWEWSFVARSFLFSNPLVAKTLLNLASADTNTHHVKEAVYSLLIWTFRFLFRVSF